MKRSKARTSGGRSTDSQSEDDAYFGKTKEPDKNWEADVADKADDAFSPYALTSRYEKGQLVTHSKFGKGLVTHVEGARVEILFQDGIKKLGHAG